MAALFVGLAAQAADAGPMKMDSWRWTSGWIPKRNIVLRNLPAPSDPTLNAAPAYDPAASNPVYVSTPPPAAAPAPAPSPSAVSADPNAWQNQGKWAEINQIVTNAAPAPSASIAPAQAVAADAYINFGGSPYAQAAALTTGGAQAWSTSPIVTKLFGGNPTDQQRADFTNAVLRRVEQTYNLSGIPLHVTSDPSVATAHSLSVVSNTGYAQNPNAIGITDIGNNGFSFIDKLGSATSIDQLEWAVAHNVAHELMHAFGVDHHDTTGTYLDAATSSWSLLLDPNAKLGPAAVQDLLSKDFHTNAAQSYGAGAEMLDPTPQPVPEPATIAMWSLAGALALGYRARRARAAA